jgi:hypothetical protein
MVRKTSVSAAADTARAKRDALRRRAVRWSGIVVAIAALLAGCAGDVALQNPHTGATVVCPGGHRELDPWSQTMACVSNYEAQGWTRIEHE